MEQEKELLKKQNEWLNAELKTKTAERLSTNREKGKELLDLRCSLDNTKEQVTRARTHTHTHSRAAQLLKKTNKKKQYSSVGRALAQVPQGHGFRFRPPQTQFMSSTD